MKFPYLQYDCEFDKETIITMYNDLLDQHYYVQTALDAALRDIEDMQCISED